MKTLHDPRVLWILIAMSNGRPALPNLRQDIAMHYLECYPFDASVRPALAVRLSRQYVSDALRRLEARGVVERPTFGGWVRRGYWQLRPFGPAMAALGAYHFDGISMGKPQ